MSLGNGQGPLNQGPKTGRQAGTCAGYDHPGYLNPNINRGYEGRGLGVGPLRGGLGRRRSTSRINNREVISVYSPENIWNDGPPD